MAHGEIRGGITWRNVQRRKRNHRDTTHRPSPASSWVIKFTYTSVHYRTKRLPHEWHTGSRETNGDAIEDFPLCHVWPMQFRSIHEHRRSFLNFSHTCRSTRSVLEKGERKNLFLGRWTSEHSVRGISWSAWCVARQRSYFNRSQRTKAKNGIPVTLAGFRINDRRYFTESFVELTGPAYETIISAGRTNDGVCCFLGRAINLSGEFGEL